MFKNWDPEDWALFFVLWLPSALFFLLVSWGVFASFALGVFKLLQTLFG